MAIDWEQSIEQLKTILPKHVTVERQKIKPSSIVREEGEHVLAAYPDQAVRVGGWNTLSDLEKSLIELYVRQLNERAKQSPVELRSMDQNEARALALRDWIFQQMEQKQCFARAPEDLIEAMHLGEKQIPLILQGDYPDAQSDQYVEFRKLLVSFFEQEVQLVPLTAKEWLILVPVSVLIASEDEDIAEGTLEESLESISSGLHEMLSNEWVGECHVSIDYPFVPAEAIVGCVMQLRNFITVGRAYQLGHNVHLPWQLRLELLIDRIAEADKAHFVERVMKPVEPILDAEMLATLEQFFALDCHVSETAKILYIHRNTLLYRLDKFKQETGLDVRTFQDAVLVKVALLLYKVTKRK